MEKTVLNMGIDKKLIAKIILRKLNSALNRCSKMTLCLDEGRFTCSIIASSSHFSEDDIMFLAGYANAWYDILVQ